MFPQIDFSLIRKACQLAGVKAPESDGPLSFDEDTMDKLLPFIEELAKQAVPVVIDVDKTDYDAIRKERKERHWREACRAVVRENFCSNTHPLFPMVRQKYRKSFNAEEEADPTTWAHCVKAVGSNITEARVGTDAHKKAKELLEKNCREDRQRRVEKIRGATPVTARSPSPVLPSSVLQKHTAEELSVTKPKRAKTTTNKA